MKLIHCADLHLDSPLGANFDKAKARERKAELLMTFARIVKYAGENDIKAVLIAGDLFDRDVVSATARNAVLEVIKSNKEITFYYLKGNHDKSGAFEHVNPFPENLKGFGDKWVSYELSDNVTLYGMELTPGNTATSGQTLIASKEKINIVMLHGQESASASDKAETINLREFRNKNIDYMALGHIHSFKLAELDGRGKYCYPGCPEGRGFDEAGDHGFVVLDIDEDARSISVQFVSAAKRRFYEVKVNVDGLFDSTGIVSAAREAIAASGAASSDMVKFVLVGNKDIETDFNLEFITKAFEDDYYLFRVYDSSEYTVDPQSYKADRSLKGEFVRSILDDESVPEELKANAIRLGIKAILGEALDE